MPHFFPDKLYSNSVHPGLEEHEEAQAEMETCLLNFFPLPPTFIVVAVYPFGHPEMI